jgi:hypothetical protein
LRKVLYSLYRFFLVGLRVSSEPGPAQSLLLFAGNSIRRVD